MDQKRKLLMDMQSMWDQTHTHIVHVIEEGSRREGLKGYKTAIMMHTKLSDQMVNKWPPSSEDEMGLVYSLAILAMTQLTIDTITRHLDNEEGKNTLDD